MPGRYLKGAPMTEAEKACQAFEDSIERGKTITAFQFFLAGAAWQREQDAKLAESMTSDEYVSTAEIAEAIRAQHAKQDTHPCKAVPGEMCKWVSCAEHGNQSNPAASWDGSTEGDDAEYEHEDSAK
jgi:hypothetical protein